MQKSRKIAQNIFRENSGVEKSSGDFDVVGRFKRKLAKVVFVQEPVEKLCAEDDCRRNCNMNVFELPAHFVIVDQSVDESQSTGFAAQRASADSGKARIGIKGVFCEFGNESALLQSGISAERGNQIFAQFIHSRKIRDFARTYFVSKPEFRSCFQPV